MNQRWTPLRHLSDDESRALAFLCAGAAVLVAVGVFLSGTPSFSVSNSGAQPAATALGDKQGVPPDYTGKDTPDQKSCYINHSPGYGCGGFGCATLCPGGPYKGFYSGIFSINPTATPAVGQSKYMASKYTASYHQRDVYVGMPVVIYEEYGDPLYYCGTREQKGDGDSGYYYEYTPFPVPAGDAYVAADSYVLYTSNFLSKKIQGLTGDGKCYGFKYFPETVTTGNPISAGGAIVVAPNIPLTLEWSCLPWRIVYGEQKTGQGLFSSGEWNSWVIYYIRTLSTGASGGGQGFSASGLTGTTKINAPATAGVHTYTLTCEGPWSLPPMSISVTVGDAPPPAAPTVSITGNGKPRAVTVEPGDPVDIEALFTAGTEALAASAINGCLTPNKSNEDVNCQTPVNSQGALGKKNYSFTPSAEGKYYFYPVVRTASLGWNDYGKKLTVTADCPASTKFKNGRCEPNLCIGAFDHATLCTGDADDVPGRTNSQLKDACSAADKCEWTCTEFGYERDEATKKCKPVACTDPHAINPPTCTCDTANGWSGPPGGVCVAVPDLDISVAQGNVRPNTPAVLSWTVKKLPEEGGIECKVTSSPANVFARTMPDPSPTAPTWSGTNVQTGNITGQTVFTLSCDNAGSVSVTVNLIPSFIEI